MRGLVRISISAVLVQLVQDAHHRQAADELGNQAVLDEVLRLGAAQQLGVAMGAGGRGVGLGVDRLEAQRLLAHAAAHHALQAHKRSAADEQDVGGIDGGELLVRVLASALRRHVGHGAFQDLEQGLLHALAADVAGDGGVLVLAADLVDLVDVDDALLGAG